jgi:hypothetical protein
VEESLAAWMTSAKIESCFLLSHITLKKRLLHFSSKFHKPDVDFHFNVVLGL